MGDLIDRQAALEALRTCYDTDRIDMDNGDEYIDYNDAVGEIEELPSAQPMRKKGKWIVHKSPDEYHCGLVECPFCGEELIAEPNEYCFCPTCGADMRGD